MTAESHADSRPFDAGLQAERTLLAWRRTTLSFAIGIALAIRLSAETAGIWAAIAGVIAFGLVIVAYIGASRRYHRLHRALMAGHVAARPGGAILAIFAAAALLAGSMALIIVCTRVG